MQIESKIKNRKPKILSADQEMQRRLAELDTVSTIQSARLSRFESNNIIDHGAVDGT